MKILIAASEAFPFCKTGGLGDVVGALSQMFSRLGDNEVVLFLPKYRNMGGGAFSLRAISGKFLIPMENKIETASMSHVQWGKVAVYFIENSKYFDRPGMYRTKYGDYKDNDERFIFFSRAVLEGAKFIGFKPDIIHCHDWQTALLPAYLNTLYRIDSFFVKTVSVFTINNIAYQGIFAKKSFLKAGFDWNDFTQDKFEFYGGMNFMKAGIVFTDRITTVSPSYSKEIQSYGEFGKGLEGVLKHRSKKLSGILNGIDDEIWNPADDMFIKRNYDKKTFAKGKSNCKMALLKECDIEEDKDILLAGVVSRLDEQKGLDILCDVIPELTDKMQFIILGAGEEKIANKLKKLAKTYPKRVFFKSGFNEALAHKIYAASDIFIMPSRFEPCGLSQMIAMLYGSLPVATKTGGLKDTVFYTGEPKDSNGFLMEAANKKSLRSALGKALALFKRKLLWNTMIRNAMNGDYLWDASAEKYLEIFKSIRKR
ncbi:MAG: glycogen/starch synthase [Elusimicrobiota bacterium]|nr:glycogen/starch synthase [Elusimicrobiota bacterium]